MDWKDCGHFLLIFCPYFPSLPFHCFCGFVSMVLNKTRTMWGMKHFMLPVTSDLRKLLGSLKESCTLELKLTTVRGNRPAPYRRAVSSDLALSISLLTPSLPRSLAPSLSLPCLSHWGLLLSLAPLASLCLLPPSLWLHKALVEFLVDWSAHSAEHSGYASFSKL